MKNPPLSYIACLAMGLLSLTSCKKESNNSASIVGNWTLSEIGTDTNNNNSIDPGETSPVASVGISGSLALKSDNSYTLVSTYSFDSQTEKGTYVYANGSLTSTPTGGSPETVLVNSLTSSRLVLKEPANNSPQWAVFTK
jgi:hypothetical protein